MIKYLIDKCNENTLSPNSLFYLYHLVCPEETEELNLFDREIVYIKRDLINSNLVESVSQKDKLIPTNKGKRLIADIEEYSNKQKDKKKSKKEVNKQLLKAEIETFVDDYRKLFQGLKVGSMGDRKGCINKFIDFAMQYPEFFNKKLILGAAKMYIDTIHDYRFLTQADYFIFKQDVNGIKISKLASFCEEVDLDKLDKKDSFSKMI